MNRDVLLAPGLWMPASAMALLAMRLERARYAPRLFAYSGRSAFDANVERLARFAREAFAGRPAHFIGHSLGGLLVLEALNRHAEVPVASAILLGAPVRGCMAGERLGRAQLGRWMMGACGPQWKARDAAWRREAPLGVVAGTLPLGLGVVAGRLPGVNDGVVRVEETAVDGMSARALVRQGHSMLIVSAKVFGLVERFLATGSFA